MVEGIRQHLFAVLRDLVYIGTEIENNRRFDLNSSEGITDAVFHILKQARVLVPDVRPNTVVCWGGHSISRVEYDYTKEVGYHLGLRGLDICTGCGPGAMKGPMKGAAIGHVKQRTGRCALHRSDRARHHRGGTAESDGEPPRGAAGHREAARSVRADGPRHRDFSRRRRHCRKRCCICSGVLMDPANADQKFPVIFTGAGIERELFRESRSTDHRRRSAKTCGASTESSSTMRRAPRSGSAARSARCRGSGARRATRTTSTGC